MSGAEGRRAAALALTFLFAGCSILHRGPAPDAPVVAPPTDVAAADTTAATQDSTSGTPDTTLAADTTTPKTSTSGVAKDAPAPKPTPETPPPEPKISAQQEVGVGLDATTKADLAVQTRKDLDEAERLVRTLAAGELSAERREKVATVDSLITSSRAAFDADIEAAASLAHKARLLAEEIGRS